MLGNNCSVDVDFLPDATGGHCKGLRDAFTPNIDFVCCRYNPLGKATSEPPTTTLASFTITDAFSVLDEYVLQQQQQVNNTHVKAIIKTNSHDRRRRSNFCTCSMRTGLQASCETCSEWTSHGD
ncbi:uncharacterized protein [Procambarus clarkii]|uniref:uncharacterized protein n=1 Tax=Procambarus clarkii TaxID=6728 RepID=UPI0037425B52